MGLIFVKRNQASEPRSAVDSVAAPQRQRACWATAMQRVRQGAIALLLAILLLMLFPSALHADNNKVSASQLFESNCAGCHAHGGNIIRRGKTLKLRSLQRNQMDSVEAIQTIVTQGKNNMSAYGDRLSQAEIEAVSAYVWQQAQAGWPRQ